jgi:hypothetical protein
MAFFACAFGFAVVMEANLRPPNHASIPATGNRVTDVAMGRCGVPPSGVDA